MVTLLKKIFRKKDDPDDFILMNNNILYNDFIIKENVHNDKFIKANKLEANSNKQNYEENLNKQNYNIEENLNKQNYSNEENLNKKNYSTEEKLPFDPNFEPQPVMVKETNYDGFKKQAQAKNDPYQPAQVKNDPYQPAQVKNDLYQPADINMVNIHENIKDEVVDELETTIVVQGKSNVNKDQSKSVNEYPLNNNPYINNNYYKYVDKEAYGNNFNVKNKMPNQDDLYGSYDNHNEWAYNSSTFPKNIFTQAKKSNEPPNILPVNIEAKEKYDIESNYSMSPELESTQNLSILQFYKDLNHFKVLSEDEKIFLAAEKAKNTIHYFIKAINNPSNQDTNFSVKAKIRDSMIEENLWINNVRYDNFMFEGVLGNYPKSIKTVKYGDILKINIDDVIDWMFVENKRLIGGYSIRVARSLMNEQDRERFDKSLFFFIDEGDDHFREDLSTPEGAITTYEEAYRRQDLNIILKCKNFKEEAKIYMLKKFGSFFYDEKSLIDLQESLKLSFIKKIEIEGFKDIDWKRRAFTRRDYIDDSLVLVTECIYKNDGSKGKLRYYVWRNPNYMWKVLCEEK
ncbi:MAG: DUF2314 domain-containing protein [Oscillospiraceae bacterium]|nr:DUF2314 domain-containing protein [Oscillospiraceae bacterium]